jgi:hypothetical protein
MVNNKKLTINGIEKLEGNIISDFRVQTIEVDDYYTISCLDIVRGTLYLTIIINREINLYADEEYVVAVMETSSGNRTNQFWIWLRNITTIDEFIDCIRWNIKNKEWIII